MISNTEADEIFVDALIACGVALIGVANETKKYHNNAFTSDDSGDDFSALVECIQWLEYHMNLNNVPIPVDRDETNRLFFRYEHEAYHAELLNWAIENRAQWTDDNANITPESAVFNPHGSMGAWAHTGAPACRLYDLLKED